MVIINGRKDLFVNVMMYKLSHFENTALFNGESIKVIYKED